MAQSASHREKVWGSLITNLNYLPGLLTLFHSLQTTQTKYSFVAFYTESFPSEGLAALQARGIQTHCVPAVQPGQTRAYDHDPRFQETWTKLVVFSLIQYERIVLLDGDMLVRKNMDELMDIPLDTDADRVFAASHACACNPMKKAHYPKTWAPANCAFTTQHAMPIDAQTTGAASSTGVGMLNSGLLVVHPSQTVWKQIQAALLIPERTDKYDFPDQELLSDVFRGRWVPLPYVYNALKTMRWEGVHAAIWRDDQVKNIHYIFAKKPWHEDPADPTLDETNQWWWAANSERQQLDQQKGITDGY
ncbi:glycogenin [Aspergillus nanangensis]|uniref:Glycogenin n=1 Tax=Aspergillus nanangensis TaxID=2582783 RepID=A0AAD4GXX6_ASPNN|nr:glycogenin [Aspergillus nanangensis]